MDIAILSGEATEFFLRWAHFLAGITWIGILYYFNFIYLNFDRSIFLIISSKPVRIITFIISEH